MLLKLVLVSALLSLPLAGHSQDSQRGNTPPGLSRDGAKPADGAIQGGKPILPGESAGVPGNKEAKEANCHDLTGSLREDCLKKERSAASGSSRAPDKEKDNMGAGGDEPGADVRR